MFLVVRKNFCINFSIFDLKKGGGSLKMKFPVSYYSKTFPRLLLVYIFFFWIKLNQYNL